MTPAPGLGVTLHAREGLMPGTILRTGPRIFWFRLDDTPELAVPLWPAAKAWTYRAVLQPDGLWREEPDKQFVEVGVRRSLPAAPRGTAGSRTPNELEAALAWWEPMLLRRRWYSMSYMAIPSMKCAVEELAGELAAYRGPEVHRVAALADRLARLRAGFRNIGGGLESVATEEVER